MKRLFLMFLAVLAMFALAAKAFDALTPMMPNAEHSAVVQFIGLVLHLSNLSVPIYHALGLVWTIAIVGFALIATVAYWGFHRCRIFLGMGPTPPMGMLFVILALASTASAQTTVKHTVISGHVTGINNAADRGHGIDLSVVEIKIAVHDQVGGHIWAQALTDNNGDYTVSMPSSGVKGSYDVIFELDGFKKVTKQTPQIDFNEDNVLKVDAELEFDPTLLAREDQPSFKFGIDFGVRSVLVDEYRDKEMNQKSGSNYTMPSFGYTAEIKAGDGWKTAVRFHFKGLDKPEQWYEDNAGAIHYHNDDPVNTVNQYGGHFLTLDMLQYVPLKRREFKAGELAIAAVGGLSYTNASRQQVADQLALYGWHDDMTLDNVYWGAKSGGSISYSIRRFVFSSEFLVGLDHQTETYTDKQSQRIPYVPGMTAPAIFTKSAGTWGTYELNWRSSAEYQATSRIGLTLTYDWRAIATPSANFLFQSTEIAASSQAYKPHELMVGLTFRP